MCLLTYFPAGVAPDPQALSIGAEANPHGHGFAVIANGHIIIGRGMNPETVIEQFTAVRTQYPGRAALFHSRFATHGVRGLSNCHPFTLGGDRRTVLAHNGVLPKRVHPGPYDPRSDTRIAAEDYLPGAPFGSIDTHRGARGLMSWLGTSKLLILTVDPAYLYSAYLFGQRAGHWDNGVWYSNTSYRSFPARWPTRRRPLRCWYCDELTADPTGRYCGRCGWCFDCEATFPDCECPTAHTPNPARALAAHRSGRSVLSPPYPITDPGLEPPLPEEPYR